MWEDSMGLAQGGCPEGGRNREEEVVVVEGRCENQKGGRTDINEAVYTAAKTPPGGRLELE